jgi:undecaprenyl-diphosphatase
LHYHAGKMAARAAPDPADPDDPERFTPAPPATTAARGRATIHPLASTVEHDPTVAAAPAGGWAAWLRALLTRAKGRLAGASLLLIGGFLVAAGALIFFGDLASEVMEGDTRAVDEGLFHALRSVASPGLDEFARLVSAMGSEVLAVLLVVLTIYFIFRRRWGAAVSLVVVTVGAQLLNNVLKDHFQRTRPSEVASFIKAQAWSFPSGHAMVSAAFYLFLVYVGWRLLRGVARAVWSGALVLLILLIGLSRLYLGAHYLTDVIAGYTAGTFWTVTVIVAGHLLTIRRRRVAVPANRR